MNFFSFLYFAVTGNDAFKGDTMGYHTYYFLDHWGCMYGILLALLVAGVCSAVFYLGLCRKFSLATSPNWWITLLVCGAVSFGLSDTILIGHKQKTQTSTFNFHGSMNEMLKDGGYHKPGESKKRNISPDHAKNLQIEKTKIETNLKKWKDVRLPFDATTGCYAMLFFVLWAFVFKGYSEHGTQIPW